MSFYKTTRTEVLNWQPHTDYPIGTIVNWNGLTGCVKPTYDIHESQTNESCKKYCIFYGLCDHYNMIGKSWYITCCGATHREDDESVFFERVGGW